MLGLEHPTGSTRIDALKIHGIVPVREPTPLLAFAHRMPEIMQSEPLAVNNARKNG
ncbi:hypothetical protein G6038_30535 [Rhodococcus sp. 14C212]|uniref:hypothetical protein n=1 Tax=Rhodococcus sp. 14C212 TaxID=2711209 RepID=UPI0013E9DE66|nr:hypothetical protein [Rhodococcus sp. 14C212]NGP09720.1 hypothetical protein [Rhodococcus sp. 14C212]